MGATNTDGSGYKIGTGRVFKRSALLFRFDQDCQKSVGV